MIDSVLVGYQDQKVEVYQIESVSTLSHHLA